MLIRDIWRDDISRPEKNILSLADAGKKKVSESPLWREQVDGNLELYFSSRLERKQRPPERAEKQSNCWIGYFSFSLFSLGLSLALSLSSPFLDFLFLHFSFSLFELF